MLQNKRNWCACCYGYGDIDQLPVVINFDLPNIPETYVHAGIEEQDVGNGELLL
jgi:hypothetical protein